jgi:hypothetical protein
MRGATPPLSLYSYAFMAGKGTTLPHCIFIRSVTLMVQRPEGEPDHTSV